jgi:uncharacterized DUF497 family protein
MVIFVELEFILNKEKLVIIFLEIIQNTFYFKIFFEKINCVDNYKKILFSSLAVQCFLFIIHIKDPIHSSTEERYIMIGLSINQKLLVVVHTDRNDRIRIIGSRKVTKNERNKYEETNYRKSYFFIFLSKEV